jgi:ornithine carbamoyltransferase
MSPRKKQVRQVPTKFQVEQKLLEAISDAVLYLYCPQETIEACTLAAYAAHKKYFGQETLDEALEAQTPRAINARINARKAA